jgi:hypothetical protein
MTAQADPGYLHQATTATASRFHHGRLDLNRKEDDMTGTPNPACPLCGLRFGSRPHLDLHIREDHRQRGHRNPGDTQMPLPPAGRASHRHNLASTPPRTTKEVTAMAATHRPRPGRMVSGPRRVSRALRYVNDELTRASEAIIRSARVPPPGRPDQATAAGHRDITERIGRAA